MHSEKIQVQFNHPITYIYSGIGTAELSDSTFGKGTSSPVPATPLKNDRPL